MNETLEFNPLHFRTPLLVALAIPIAVLAGCQKNRHEMPIEPLSSNIGGQTTTDGNGTGMSGVDTEGLPPFDSGTTYFERAGELDPVYFAYDSAALDAPARTDLDAAAQFIQSGPDSLIQIAGHCDERGTQEYNLALGERRAQSVRNYLRQLGIPGDRLITISYGEESPAVSGSSEAAWAQNRRCEFYQSTL